MREDPAHSKLRDEKLSLEKLIKDIEKIIHEQKIVQGQTDRGKTDPRELKNNQNKVTQATAKVAKEVAKKTGQGGEAKNTKGAAKEGGKAGKKGESKDAGKQAAGTKKANAKDDGAKAGSKGGEKKADGKAGAKNAKGPAAKQGDAKQADAKAGSKTPDSKQASAKGTKSAVAKPGDAKSGGQKSDSKDSKQAAAKSGQKSSGQGQAKNGAPQSQPKADQKGDNQPPQPQQPQDNVANGKKQIQDAEYKMKMAEDEIAKLKNKAASDDQGKAIKDLELAKKKLEDLLRQLARRSRNVSWQPCRHAAKRCSSCRCRSWPAPRASSGPSRPCPTRSRRGKISKIP